MNYQLILASGSPRRRELLKKAGFDFWVVVSDAEESYTEEEPAGIVRELAALKAEAVAAEPELWASPEKEECGVFPASKDEGVIVLGADTVVSADGQILGKPKDEEEAKAMIRSIQGRAHEVHTGVCLIRMEQKESGACKEQVSACWNRTAKTVFSVCTKVHVVPMTEDEISAYVSCGESMDKAGAYAIQGEFGKYIDFFDGDYENVIGLPAERVKEELQKLGLNP